MDRLNTLLSKVLHRRGIYTDATASFVVYRAECWLKDHLKDVASFLHVESFKDGILTLSADNSIAAQECSVIREVFLSALQGQCGDIPVVGISVLRASGR